MIIKINGKNEVVDAKINLAELVRNKKLQVSALVIEHNGNIASQEKWKDILLDENDNLEIVSFVSGG